MPSDKRTVYLLPAGIVVLGATIAIVVALVGTAAAAAFSSVDTGSQNFRGARDLGLAPRPATVSSVDTGSQNFRGEQDLTAAAARLGATPTIPAAVSAPKITEALQPGQTVSAVVSPAARYDPAHEHITPGNGSDPVYGPTLWTPAFGPTEAPQPGQTDSMAASGNGSAPVGGPTSAPQPGQTDSMAASGNGYPPAPWAPAFGPTEAPQPGQTDSMAASGNGSAPVGGPTSAVQRGQTDSMAASGNGYPPAPWAPAFGPTSAPQPGQTGW